MNDGRWKPQLIVASLLLCFPCICLCVCVCLYAKNYRFIFFRLMLMYKFVFFLSLGRHCSSLEAHSIEKTETLFVCHQPNIMSETRMFVMVCVHVYLCVCLSQLISCLGVFILHGYSLSLTNPETELLACRLCWMENEASSFWCHGRLRTKYSIATASRHCTNVPYYGHYTIHH